MSVLEVVGKSAAPTTSPAGQKPLTVLLVNSRRADFVRRLIAAAIVCIGVAGLASLPTADLTPFGEIAIPVLAASAVPIGLAWLLVTWSEFACVALIVYADVGIVVVLSGFESSFLAMPGTAELVMVSLFALAFAPRRILVLQSVFNVVVLVGFSVAAVVQGTDPWFVCARALVIAGVFVATVTIQFFLIYLIRQLGEAQRDPATGLLNRIGLESEMTASGPRLSDRAVLVVISVVIDDLEHSQRRFGRVAVEGAITETAVLLRDQLPADAVLARTATGEFVACAWRSSPRDSASDPRDLETKLASYQLRSLPAVLQCGVGVVEYSGSPDGPPRDISWTMQRGIAAAELRRRKWLSANEIDRVGRVGESIDEVRARIQAVIDGGGPNMVFQPIRRSDDLSIVGYEALSRFAPPEESPQRWFADAGYVGLGSALDRQAVLQALRIADRSLPDDAFVSINVSASTLLVGDVPQLLVDASPRRRVMLEITEHDEIDEYDAVVSVIRELRSQGVDIAVDDVGSGYAGLRQLVTLTPDVIKVDASIIRAMDVFPARRAAAAAIAVFARETNARSVFEGIETEEELAVAREVGADLLQGYRLGRPMPAEVAGTEPPLDDVAPLCGR